MNDIELLGSAVYSRWRYFNHWAYKTEEILEHKNRTWFILALSRLAVLSEKNPFIFKGTPKKLSIVSNNISYGPCPEPADEVEQHITINANGQVWFSAYAFGQGFGKFEKARRKNFKIEKNTAQYLLNAIAAYFSQEYVEVFATDIGEWQMELTNTDDEVYKYRGSLCADFEVDGTDLSDLIRYSLNMDDLYAFDGNCRPDKVNRIIVEYRHVTRIKPKQHIESITEYITGDYTEKLIIDRESETIEHVQNTGTGCVVSRKYKVDSGVKGLLDDLDADGLFLNVAGNPPDVVESPNETRDYIITVDFKKGPQRIIRGTYDKYGLPDDWADFAETVLDFMRFYGFGEIFDPSIYNKVKRRKNDYIFCSVTFDGGYKSYYYLADDDSIEVGDYVLVPAGKDNHIAVAEVVKIEYFSKEEAPLPLEKTKHIIRKYTDTAD